MFTIIAKDDVIAKMQVAMENELQEIVSIFPNFKEKIEQTILWGIFSKESIFNVPKEKYRNHEAFASLSYEIVEKAKEELKKQGQTQVEFFVPTVDKAFKETKVGIFLDYEDCDVKVENNTEVKMKKDVQVVIAATLPDSSVVFETLVEGNMFDEANRWLWDYMDLYDKWKYKIMDSLYSYVWQIGGHGRWIQSDYNDTYVGQANIEIGDAGSVFIEICDNEMKSYVDMY